MILHYVDIKYTLTSQHTPANAKISLSVRGRALERPYVRGSFSSGAVHVAPDLALPADPLASTSAAKPKSQRRTCRFSSIRMLR